jgi:hypothetical protein
MASGTEFQRFRVLIGRGGVAEVERGKSPESAAD